ncbi:MAG: hypothetical protein LBG19_12200 [Prevotellaceae bacterium]|nr:hypothetical protein [Prevotellaceae bacterium]
MNQNITRDRIQQLAFTAYAEFLLIHPQDDGSRRMSGIILRSIETMFNTPLTKVSVADIVDYSSTLEIFLDKKDTSKFNDFMLLQHVNTVKEDIRLLSSKRMDFLNNYNDDEQERAGGLQTGI